MPLLRAAALLALLSAAACASGPKPANRSAGYDARYQQCMYQAWASVVDWKTRKAMCREQAAAGDNVLGPNDKKPADETVPDKNSADKQ